MLGATIDVTGRKQSMSQLMEQRDQLTHLSRVAMLGQMSGSLAHELNQPLTAILSNAQAAQRFLAIDNVDLDEVREILKDIVTDDQRAGEVIRRLRLLLKKGELHRLPLDLNDAVQEVLNLVRNDLLNDQITLRTEFAPDLPIIEGDRVQLEQVMLNFIVNATEAMQQVATSEKELVVRTERLRDDGVRLSVSDTGSGIAPDIVNEVFDAFITTKPAGMGLGLKVCRTIIEAHGGRLGGKNNPVRGATFHFEIPPAQSQQT